MLMYDISFLKRARLCDEYDVLLIFDEVQFGRQDTGFVAGLDWFGMSSRYTGAGKALTGVLYIGHAVTVANHKVYQAFTGMIPPWR